MDFELIDEFWNPVFFQQSVATNDFSKKTSCCNGAPWSHVFVPAVPWGVAMLVMLLG